MGLAVLAAYCLQQGSANDSAQSSGLEAALKIFEEGDGAIAGGFAKGVGVGCVGGVECV